MEAPSSPEEVPSTAGAHRLLSAELLVGLLAAAAALLLVTWLGREVLEGEVLTLDDRVRAIVHAGASPRLTALMRAASLYGGPGALVPVGLVVALAFLIRGWRRGALLVVVTLAGAGLLNGLLKFSFARVRPTPFFDYPLPASASFPSGHALFAASFFGGLAVLISPRIRSRPLRVAVWLCALGLTLLVGLSRVYLGVHYPSDVLAGYAAATVWVTAVALGDRIVRYRRARRSV
jgi:membrane-associated phospholipid phosphatase